MARQLRSVVPGSNEGTERSEFGMLWDDATCVGTHLGAPVTHPSTTHSAASSSSLPPPPRPQKGQESHRTLSPHLVSTRGRGTPAFARAMAFVR